MRSAKMRIRLTPLNGGAYTQLQLSGPIPTAPQSRQWRNLIAMLSHWNGYPVHAVLSAADPAWREAWTHALRNVPERDLDLRVRCRPVE